MDIKLRKVSTSGMSREKWLERRRHSIGGSDAAGIIGLSKYSTPYTVWADKTGRLPEKPDTEAMRQGRDLEDYVARRWAEETGKRVRKVNSMIYNPDYRFAHADVDRMVVGEEAGLECKTTSTLDVRQFNGVEFPEKYYAQCVHYMAVTGAKRWYLAVLVFGRGFYTYTMERNQDEIDALMRVESDFWKDVENDTPPPLDGEAPTSDALTVVYADSGEGRIDLFGRDFLLDEWADLKRQKEAVESRINEISNIIKGDMGDIPSGSCGRYSVSWKTQERRTFQVDAFIEDHPGIDLSKYYKVSKSRPFKITENKETKEEI